MTAPHLTDAEIAELRRLEAAATPFRWNADNIDIDLDGDHRVYSRTALNRRLVADSLHRHDALLIVAARNALPRLLAEIERLREDLADWQDSARRAAGEQCGDEKHCTCVGVLRAEIERLRAAVKHQFTAAFAKLREELGPDLGKGGGLIEILNGIGGLREKVRDLRDVLLREGYRECDNPACNCNSWHPHGGFYARFQEIDVAVGDHDGKTLLQAVKDIVAERDRMRAELREVTP